MVQNTYTNYIGKTNFRGEKKFGIKREDRRHHAYVVGKTGTGKTTLLKQMAVQDIRNGEGVAVIDPHGDLAEELLDYVPKERINDVVYFNPADLDYPIGLNVFKNVDSSERHLVASGLMSVFKRLFHDSWGPRLEHILRNSIYALLEFPGSTLLGIPRLLYDDRYREKVVEKVEDPKVKDFWKNEYSNYDNSFRTQAISPVLNKVGKFLTTPLLRNIIGQAGKKLDFSEILEDKKILISNLSKGALGEENQTLLGSLIVTKLQLAAMQRVDEPAEERSDFYLYVDEFQNFSSSKTITTLLSEARKYLLNAVLANQYISQLDKEIREAVFGNVGTIITFRVGAKDAKLLEKEFEPEFSKDDLINLPNYQIYLRLMIDGVSSRPFSARTLPPPEKPETSHKDKIIKVSRERYCTPREEVERKIDRWFDITDRSMRRG
ncbi:MAG: type IV secretion system DNA-binding domain-containing protein [Candidatus Bipolaricaulota bacterium]|nr:type IV secretion system DNA-binding domain-containing protein [Candidatus Bipolaricaulota bacterium]